MKLGSEAGMYYWEKEQLYLKRKLRLMLCLMIVISVTNKGKLQVVTFGLHRVFEYTFQSKGRTTPADPGILISPISTT